MTKIKDINIIYKSNNIIYKNNYAKTGVYNVEVSKHNLLNISQLCDRNIKVIFKSNTFAIIAIILMNYFLLWIKAK